MSAVTSVRLCASVTVNAVLEINPVVTVTVAVFLVAVLNHALMPMSSWHVLTPVVVLKALHGLADTAMSLEVPEVMLSDTVAASTCGFPKASRTW